jgi:rubrerythrin
MNEDPRNDTEQQIDILIKDAMSSELKAKSFYLDASTRAQSQAGKKLFTELAEFEQNHYARLKNIYESRQKEKGIDDSPPCLDTPVIPPEVTGEFEPNKDEVTTIIGQAITAEKEAQVRYQQISDLLDDPKGKKLFHNLAEEERHHQKILEDQFYHMSNKGTIIWE